VRSYAAFGFFHAELKKAFQDPLVDDTPAARATWGAWLFVLVLGVLGTACIWAGWDMIQKKHAVWETRSVSGVHMGPIGFHKTTHEREVLDGPEAVRHGAGVMSLGGLLALWSISLTVTMGCNAWHPGETGVGRWLIALALVCLVAAAFCFGPPWRWGSCAFWLTVLFMAGWFAFALRRKKAPKCSGWVFTGLVAAAIFGGAFDAHFTAGIILGVFFAVFVVAHWFVLATLPSWLKDLPSNKARGSQAVEGP